MIDEDIGWFEVTVEDAFVVSGVDGSADGQHQFGGLSRIEWSVGHLVRECDTFDQSHAEVRQSLVLADLVDWHDVGMFESSGTFGFTVKPGEVDLGGPIASKDHLDGHIAIEAGLVGPVDDPHPASAQFFEQLVFADRFGHCLQGCRWIEIISGERAEFRGDVDHGPKLPEFLGQFGNVPGFVFDVDRFTGSGPFEQGFEQVGQLCIGIRMWCVG